MQEVRADRENMLGEEQLVDVGHLEQLASFFRSMQLFALRREERGLRF